jgi:hypothetical protein
MEVKRHNKFAKMVQKTGTHHRKEQEVNVKA